MCVYYSLTTVTVILLLQSNYYYSLTTVAMGLKISKSCQSLMDLVPCMVCVNTCCLRQLVEQQIHLDLTVVHLPVVFINTSLTSATCIWKSELVMPLARDLRHSASHLLSS